jgi:Protein of unknown function (DUF3995)
MTNRPGMGAGESASSRWWALRMAAAACAWAVLFAALSFFWAAGGRTGLQPLEQPPASSRAVWLVADLAAGILKIGGGLLALALVHTGEHRRIHRMLLAAAWIGGVGLCLYGGLGLVSDVLHVAGIISDPATRKWFFWYLVLWDPWFVLGGVLYVATAWFTRRSDAELAAAHSRSTRAEGKEPR